MILKNCDINVQTKNGIRIARPQVLRVRFINIDKEKTTQDNIYKLTSFGSRSSNDVAVNSGNSKPIGSVTMGSTCRRLG